jgi:hypothetical protein
MTASSTCAHAIAVWVWVCNLCSLEKGQQHAKKDQMQEPYLDSFLYAGAMQYVRERLVTTSRRDVLSGGYGGTATRSAKLL